MKVSGEKIKILQAEAGYKQSDFAEIAGISRAAYSNILARGTCHPSSLVKIAKALNVNPNSLLEKEKV